jgi:predicted nuclease with TOPRIM domain
MGQETAFIWEKLELSIAENALLKEKNNKLTKEREELSARWENLNKVVEKKFDYRTERVFDPTAFHSKINISVIFDEDLYRASQIEFVEGIIQKVVPLFQSELSKMLNRPKY